MKDSRDFAKTIWTNRNNEFIYIGDKLKIKEISSTIHFWVGDIFITTEGKSVMLLDYSPATERIAVLDGNRIQTIVCDDIVSVDTIDLIEFYKSISNGNKAV